jgi:hypothetical protein
MREHKLYLWLEKFEFEQTRIEYLGIIISHNKVEIDLMKIAGVADWLMPSNRGAILHRLHQLLPTIHSWVTSPCVRTL